MIIGDENPGALTGLPGTPGSPPGVQGQTLSPRHRHTGSGRDGNKISALDLDDLEGLMMKPEEVSLSTAGSSLKSYADFSIRWIIAELVYVSASGGGRGRIVLRLDGDAHGLSYNGATDTYTGALTAVLVMVDTAGNSKTVTLTHNAKGWTLTWSGATNSMRCYMEVYGYSNRYANKLKNTFNIS